MGELSFVCSLLQFTGKNVAVIFVNQPLRREPVIQFEAEVLISNGAADVLVFFLSRRSVGSWVQVPFFHEVSASLC